jgi:hypothetical protein
MNTKKFDWEKTKVIVECLAIVLAGVFAFFTWGFDYLYSNTPNWDLEIDQVSDYKLIKRDGINRLARQKDYDSSFEYRKKVTGFSYSGRVKIKNDGKRPIVLSPTTLRIYIIKRNSGNHFIDSSPYYYEKLVSDSSAQISVKLPPIVVEEIDPAPVYPGNEGWRPFTFEMDVANNPNGQTFEDFSAQNVLLIKAEQNVRICNLLLPDYVEKSKVAYLVQSIGQGRDFIRENGK